jgi:hypothetical protein
MTRVVAIAFGIVAYAAFLASSSYAIGFVGNLLVPKSIDSGRGDMFRREPYARIERVAASAERSSRESKR